VTQKSIGFLCYPGQMCGPSLRKAGQGVLKLLIGNEMVTDRQTDTQTCANQYTLLRREHKEILDQCTITLI